MVNDRLEVALAWCKEREKAENRPLARPWVKENREKVNKYHREYRNKSIKNVLRSRYLGAIRKALKRKNESLKKGSSLLPIGRMIKHRYTVGLKREEERYGKSKRELMDGYDYLMKNYLLYKEKAKNSRTLEERKKYIQKSENYHNKAKRILTKFTFL